MNAGLGRNRVFSVYVALGVALGVSLAMCSVPLLGIHGAESALLLGVALPPFAAWGAAALVRQYRNTPAVYEGGLGLSPLFMRCSWFGALLWGVPVGILALDALRVRNCSPGEGFAFMVLGPGFGIALGVFTGMFAALLLPRARITPLLAAIIPVATMLAALWRFYAGPGIFAYGHYFGFFPGTLYDEGVSLTGPLWWLRVETALWITALILLIVSGTPATLRWQPWPRSGYELAFGAALLCAALGCSAELYSDALGNTTSSARVREALGGERVGARCRLFFPREWAERDRRRIAEDCDYRVQRAENWLGLSHAAKVDVYLFRSPAEKYALMGAEATNIAKPWRSETYISEAGWPNPVLGHELVHVVARAAGAGPLRISGSFGGLWPNPALIEGVAVAAAWQAQGGLTPHEWAHAMLELNMVPALRELFGASFLGQQKRLAYTLSGSLLRFVHERWGQKAVVRTYRLGDLERGVGKPLVAIENAWREYLRAQPLAASSLALARARFSGGSILSAVCPHTLAKLRDSMRAEVNAGDDKSAKQECEKILAVDPQDAGTRASLAALQARLGDPSGAARELERLTQMHAPAPYIAAVKQAFADQALREGRAPEALKLYRELLAEPVEEDQKRQLQVKLLAAQGLVPGESTENESVVTNPWRQAELLTSLLIGAPGEHADPATAVYLARELRTVRNDGLAIYLEARQLFFQARFELAAPLLAEARRLQLPTPELRAEALRVEAISRTATRDFNPAVTLFTDYRDEGGAARAAEADDYLARIRFMSASH